MTNDSLQAIIEYMTSSPWALEARVMQQLCGIVERHISGVKLEPAEIENITAGKNAAAEMREFEITRAGVAVIPVTGVIAKYSRMVNGVSQARGTSLQWLNTQLDEAMGDQRVTSIFLHIESPGGSSAGLADFADRVYQASFDKPVTAFADDLAASAAYWIGSQANEFYANQSALVGSIGAYLVMVDSSARAAKEGFKFHLLRSGSNKGVGTPGVAITDENIEVVQNIIDQNHEMFIQAILRGRMEKGMDSEGLREMADGRVYYANQALDGLLIDGIMSLSDALAKEPASVRSESGITTTAETVDEIDNTNFKEMEMSEKEKKQPTVGADELAANAVTAERTRISGINTALGGDDFAELRNKCIDDGSTLADAKSAAFDLSQKLRADEASASQAVIDEKQSRLDTIATAGTDMSAGDASDKDEELGEAAGDDGKANTYHSAVARYQGEGMTKGQAMQKAVKEYPDSYNAVHENMPKHTPV